jgi:hypothetical protein
MSVSDFQRDAALRVKDLVEQMGPEGTMSLDPSYRENFMGSRYNQPWKSLEEPMLKINDAIHLANRSKKHGPEVDRANAIAARAALAESNRMAAARSRKSR